VIRKNNTHLLKSVKFLRFILLINILILFPVNSIAEEKPDSLADSRIKIQFYPYLFYTPETHLAFGAAAISYFRSSANTDNKPSKISLSGYYSTRKQYIITMTPEIYLKNGNYFIPVDLYFGNFADKFWGIGNNTADFPDTDYIMRSYGIKLAIQPKIKSNFKAGVVIKLKNSIIVDKKENPFLISNSVQGSNGGMIFGSGLAISLDSRDNIFYPSRGRFYELNILIFSRMWNSDFDFNRYILNFRQYFSAAKNHVLALQVYGNFVGGYPPFYELPALGGQNTLRGYFLGRYRDKQYVLTQAEYRTTVWWRIGIVGFAGVGDVVSRLALLQLSELKYSLGAGLRFALDVEEKLNVRIDFGIGKNSTGIYFAVEEAF
jgi:outer membrane protein assembly factor BamA